MAANLTPQYQKAEQEYRRAQTSAEQDICLQRMLQLIPKHKGTEKLQADLKTRLKELRVKLQQESEASGRSGNPFRFARQGAGRVVIIGPPNCGKSRILKELSNAAPEVSPWPFTTREPSAGMVEWNDVPIQLIDTPPLAGSQPEPWLLNLIRTADAALLVFNGSDDDAPSETLRVLEELNRRKTRLSTEAGFDVHDFAVMRLRTRVIATHADDPDSSIRIDLLQELCGHSSPFRSLLTSVLPIELNHSAARQVLTDAVFTLLKLIRVYTRKPGTAGAHASPVTIPQGGTVEDLALALHEELFEHLMHARIWRTSNSEIIAPPEKLNSHEGQVVGRQYVLHDRDIVELHRS